MIFNMYGLVQNMEKIRVWKEIEEKLIFYKGEILIMGGDFNTILGH